MVDMETLASILGSLRRQLLRLSVLAALPEAEFVADFTKVESAKHLLQVSVECCLDIAHHIVAEEGYRTPDSYYDTFAVLAENGVVPEAFLPTLRQMVGFRNRVVHLYWEVDDATVYRILREDLGDFETYIAYILKYARQDDEQGNPQRHGG